jgi:hypothetical protein
MHKINYNKSTMDIIIVKGGKITEIKRNDNITAICHFAGDIVASLYVGRSLI